MIPTITRKQRDSMLLENDNINMRLEQIASHQVRSIREVNQIGGPATYLNPYPFEPLSFVSGKVYIGNRHVGHYRGRSAVLSGLTLTKDPSQCQEVVLERATSCAVRETASSAPSMMLHQIASLSFLFSLANKGAFEELCGDYRPDIMIPHLGKFILIDITSDKTEEKLENMPEDYSCVAISKYKILKPQGLLEKIYELSLENDAKSTDFIYSLAEKNSRHHSRQMLYTKDLLDFFASGKDKHGRSIQYHCRLATEALKADYLRVPEVKPQTDICALIISKLSSIDLPTLRDNEVHILPANAWLPVREQRATKPKTDQEVETMSSSYYDVKGATSESKELFTMIEVTALHPKAFMSIERYPVEKLCRDALCEERFKRFLKVFGNLTSTYQFCMMDRIDKHTGIRYINGEPQLRNRTTKHPVYPVGEPISKPYDQSEELLDGRYQLDPDHFDFLTSKSAKTTIAALSRSRDYQELRFRARISTAICLVKKPGSCFKVTHFNNENIYAEVYISGLIFEKDKGVTYVSYFYNGVLYRTDKWRLPDVENYSVAHHRLCALLYSLESRIAVGSHVTVACQIYSRILSENSWGASKFFKAYRYFSSGVCMNSYFCDKSIEKMIKEIGPVSRNKASTSMIVNLLLKNAKKGLTRYGLTPLFLFPFQLIGWDAFLVSLCPSSTYGRNKHIYDTLDDLADEIDLFNSVEPTVKRLYEDFETIISTEAEASSLVSMYSNHLSKIRDLSAVTGGRFSYSPIGTLLIQDEIQDLKVTYSKLQGNMPRLSQLMTAKASHSPFTGKPQMAMHSIMELSNVYKTRSTSLLALRVLTKEGLIDLTMRMFDKDQVGGNREISILTSEFRILQVTTEYVMRALAEMIDTDLLQDPEKINTVVGWLCDAINNGRMENLTADQTKWGPNSPTASFGLMNLSLLGYSTEAYMPAAICLASEFKVFEMCPWMEGSLIRSDSSNTLAGKVGRYHMGQGIFHQTSSVYHSLVVRKLNRVAVSMIRIPGSLVDSFGDDHSKSVELVIKSAVTSDDLATIAYERKVMNIDDEAYNEIKPVLDAELDRVRDYYSRLSVLFLYFGIKTSEHKNITSDSMIEFNSVFLSKDSLGSTDIKFIYSLIEPGTTGNFLFDMSNSLNTYYNALGTNCSYNSAVAIANMNYLRLCRQWRIRPDVTGLPSDKSLQMGIIPSYKIKTEETGLVYLESESTLRFKTRDLFKPKEDYLSDFLALQEKLVITNIAGTRAKQNYRSIIAYPTTDKITVMSPFFTYSNSIGETYSRYARETFKNPNHPMLIRHPAYEKTYYHQIEEFNPPNKTLQMITIRKSMAQKTDYLSLAVSYYPRQDYISSDSTEEELLLHFMRNLPRFNMESDMFGVKTASLLEKMDAIESKLDEITQPNFRCSRILYNTKGEQLTFSRLVVYPPHSDLLMPVVLESFSLSPELLWSNDDFIGSSLTSIHCLHVTEDMQVTQVPLARGKRCMDYKKERRNIPIPNKEMINQMSLDFLYASEQIYRTNLGQTEIYLNLLIDMASSTSVDFDNFLDNLEIKSMDEYGDTLLLSDRDELKVTEPEIYENVEPDLTELAGLVFDQDAEESATTEWVSLALPRRFGILCNPSFTLRFAVLEYFLRLLESEEVIPSRLTPRSLRSVNIKKGLKVYTVDPDLSKKLRVATTNVVLQLNCELDPLYKCHKEMINSLISHQNPVLTVECLAGSPPGCSFTSEPMGRIVDYSELGEIRDANRVRVLNGFVSDY